MEGKNTNKLLFFCLLMVIFVLGTISAKTPALSPSLISHFTPVPHVSSRSNIRLLFVGDIMLSRGVADQINRNQSNSFPFENVYDFLKKADLTFGNLESPISDQGTDLGHLYSFRAPLKSIEGLAKAGFDVLSLANNHSYDWGPEALKDTISRLRAQKISTVGAGQNSQEAYQPKIIDIKGQKIAFLAATDIPPKEAEARSNRAGVAWMKPNIISQQIQKIKSQVDFIVVSMHSGSEYQKHPNADQRKFARQIIDAGANLVISHHPHVIQEYEKYKNGYIFYSLGNFIFDQNWSDETSKGLIVEVRLTNKTKEINTYNVIISKSTFQPEISLNSKKQIFIDR